MADTLNIINERLAKVTLITEDDIKVNTPMSANKSKSSLINHICVSQDLHIRKILGATLYDKLLAEWVANLKVADDLPDGTGTGTPPIISGDTTNYKQLYWEVYKPLIWWSYVLSLSDVAIQVSEAGLLFRSTQNAESGGIEGLKKLVAENEAIARSYTEMLLTYINETFCNDESVDAEKKDIGGASIGIFIPRKSWNNKSEY